VTPATHFDDVSDPGFSTSVPMLSDQAVSGPFPSRSRFPSPGAGSNPGTGSNLPTERVVPPTILGSHLGLQPGETATERSLRLMSAVGELERQVDALGSQNAELNLHISQRDDQLLLAIREIRAARKEVASARDELERLRQQVKALQLKVGDAERDNAALLQTMSPLLLKLLEADGTGALPEDPQP
jgi:hypothetical protein